ncbi:MAG: LytR/AlgR family response regulator transcription factor [Lewinella sp.]
MSKLSVVIVDDEPFAHRVLEDYCQKIGDLKVIHNCYDGLSALSFLQQTSTDLLLLDIHMPDFDGLELLDHLRTLAPKTILTTAYSKYAMDSFDYDQVVDFLHKPVKLTRFVKAVNRVRKIRLLEAAANPSANQSHENEFLLIPADGRTERIRLADIWYVRAWGNYLRINLRDGQMIISRKTLKALEEELSDGRFARIHKSFLINIGFFTAIEGNEIISDRLRLPIGNIYRVSLRRALQE